MPATPRWPLGGPAALQMRAPGRGPGQGAAGEAAVRAFSPWLGGTWNWHWCPICAGSELQRASCPPSPSFKTEQWGSRAGDLRGSPHPTVSSRQRWLRGRKTLARPRGPWVLEEKPKGTSQHLPQGFQGWSVRARAERWVGEEFGGPSTHPQFSINMVGLSSQYVSEDPDTVNVKFAS